MNRSAHVIAGSITSASVYAIITKSLDEEQTLKGFIFFLVAGGFMGALPDIIEPATSPNHRSFFHSIALLCAGGYLLYRFYVIKDITNQDIKIVITALCAAYGSHLVLDALTPMGLPLC